MKARIKKKKDQDWRVNRRSTRSRGALLPELLSSHRFLGLVLVLRHLLFPSGLDEEDVNRIRGEEPENHADLHHEP